MPQARSYMEHNHGVSLSRKLSQPKAEEQEPEGRESGRSPGAAEQGRSPFVCSALFLNIHDPC